MPKSLMITKINDSSVISNPVLREIFETERRIIAEQPEGSQFEHFGNSHHGNSHHGNGHGNAWHSPKVREKDFKIG